MSNFKALEEPGKAYSGKWEVVKTIWMNKDNSWGIWSFRKLEDGELYKVTGAKPHDINLENGTIVEMNGKVVIHPSYGASLRMSEINILKEVNEKERYRQIEKNAVNEAYRSFLIMRFKGIGEVWSSRLIESYEIEQIEDALEKGNEDIFMDVRMPKKLIRDTFNQYRNIKARVSPFSGILSLMKLGMNNDEIIKNVSMFAQSHRVEKETSVDHIFKSLNDSKSIQDFVNGLSLIDTVYGRSISNQDTFSNKINRDIEALIKANGASFFQWMKTSVPDISINRIDKIWLAKGGEIDDYHRLFFISDNIIKNKIMQTGSVGIDLKEITKAIHDNTGLTMNDSKEWIEHVSSEPNSFIMLSGENNKVYYVPFVAKERMIAENLYELMQQDTQIDEEKAERIVKEVIDEMSSDENRIELDEKQKEAVKSALINPVFILTGGPGCGKTFTLNIVIAALKKIGQVPDLMAPTGKAAKRAEEMTGIQGHTIHRRLKINPMEDDILTMRARGELQGNIAIVDEVSMIDIPLMDALVQGVRAKQETSKIMPTRLILVGDSDQLPSVGPGDILRDMIESEKIPHVRLTKVFRQGNDALGIIDNAQRINAGEMPENAKNMGFEIKCPDGGANISDEIEKLAVQEAIKAKKENKNIMFLTPMRKKGAGVEKLNIALKAIFNPRPSNIVYVSAKGRVDPEDILKDEQIKVFSNGDKIIQTRNNYKLTHPKDEKTRELLKSNKPVDEDKLIAVMNGETGDIIETLEDGFVVAFNKGYEDEKEVFIDFKSAFKQLEHAWAITVHKSQGSQAEKVVVIMDDAHENMLNKKIFYTAVTRAEKECVVIGSENAIRKAVNNKNEFERETTLKESLQLVFEQKDSRLEESPMMMNA